MNCLTLIDNAWPQVTYIALNSAWTKLWPDSVAERAFDWSEPDDSALINEVVSMGINMGLEVECEHVHELLKNQEMERNTEELLHLQEEKQ